MSDECDVVRKGCTEVETS